MPLAASADAARVNRRRGSAADGVTFWHTLYIGTSRYNMTPGSVDPDSSALFPMAFLVEQDPGSTANAHYHQQDQFQLVVNGRATLGLHEVAPVTVHFTGAFTAYGPIRADAADGVWYFTLRNGFDPGARFMSMAENRAHLRTVPQRVHREAVSGPLTPTACGQLLAAADGMGAWRHRLAPGETITGPDPATGRGQYWVVIGGAMESEDGPLPPRSCVFVYPEDAPFQATAGAEGLDVIAMQFPRRTGSAIQSVAA